MPYDFFDYERPLLCAMIHPQNPTDAIQKIKASLADGAEAFGFQMEKLEHEYRNEATIRQIFEACEGRPIYATSYRGGHNVGFTDEQCAEFLLFLLDCGATLCDVMGDMFDRSPYYELTKDPEAIRKQKKLIDEIHRRGGKVLMSCHTHKDLSIEESLMIAKEQASRGADVLKIVNKAESTASLPKHIETIQTILSQTDKKLLYLLGGEGTLIRYIGANFGVCMYLCVAYHGPLDTKGQPLLKQAKAIRDNITF